MDSLKRTMITLALLIFMNMMHCDVVRISEQLDMFDLTANYNWVCFPRLAVRDGINSGKEGDFVYPDWQLDAEWTQIPNQLYLFDSVHNGPANNFVCCGTMNGGDLDWIPCNYQIFSSDGLKISKADTLVTGGYLLSADYRFPVLRSKQENWLGYFLEASQHPYDAISSGAMSQILEIKTQDWSVNRQSITEKWNIDREYTFNYGDCVIVTPAGNISNFQWQQSNVVSKPFHRKKAIHFDWNEEIDYRPIYVEFDPGNVPEEVAVYVGDECKGAQVVEDTITQICAYILEERKDLKIEFVFYKNGQIVRNVEYLVIDNDTGEIVSNLLKTGTKENFHKITFNSNRHLPLEVKYNINTELNNESNETIISFEIEDESDVSLNIYNCKGQKIRTLVDETLRPDDFNIVWKGYDDNGHCVGSGMYFVKLKIDNELFTNKVIMLK